MANHPYKLNPPRALEIGLQSSKVRRTAMFIAKGQKNKPASVQDANLSPPAIRSGTGNTITLRLFRPKIFKKQTTTFDIKADLRQKRYMDFIDEEDCEGIPSCK